MDWCDGHVVLNQLHVFDLVGVLFRQCRPSDFRIDDKGGAFTGRIEHKRLRRIRELLRIITAIAHIYFGFETRPVVFMIAAIVAPLGLDTMLN